MLKSSLLLIAVILMLGCSSNKGGYTSPDEVVYRLKQLTESELAIKLGSPTQRVALSDGSETWTYRDDSEGLTGGECVVTVLVNSSKVTDASISARDRSWVSFPLGSCANILGNLD